MTKILHRNNAPCIHFFAEYIRGGILDIYIILVDLKFFVFTAACPWPSVVGGAMMRERT
jgi:hypothetical protein